MFNTEKYESMSAPSVSHQRTTQRIRSRAPTHPHTSNPRFSASERRLLQIGALLAMIAVVGSLLATLGGPAIAEWLPVQLNAHGHSRVHAHGHPFIDARALWSIPNAMDVLSNLAFVPMGLWGLWSLHKAPLVHQATRHAANVFFVGLLLTCLSSSYYHWAPSAWGLAIDRAGMAVAFAGVLGLACAERVSLRAAPYVWASVLLAGLLAAWLNYAVGVIAPWAVVQFGGMAVVLWAASQPRQSGALGIRWGVLIAIYVVAKLFEMADESIYSATDALVSGHSLKHIAASLAALPVVCALRHNAKHKTGPY
jgi:hypothetical protein